MGKVIECAKVDPSSGCTHIIRMDAVRIFRYLRREKWEKTVLRET